MAMLSREEILKAEDLRSETVPVPEWGGEVRVRMLTAGERDQYECAMLQARRDGKVAPDNVRARFVALCLIDADGDRMFDAADIERLGGKSGGALDRVYQAAVRLNAIADEDFEEMEGNSDAAPSGDSSSD